MTSGGGGPGEAIGAISGELVVLALVVLYLIRLYASPGVSLDVKVSVFAAWLLGFAGILLLPYDISLATSSASASASAPVLVTWKLIYWATFVLAWLVLPLQHDFHRSGHFKSAAKLKEAVRRNLVFYASVGALGIVYVVYMLATNARNSVAQVVGFLMACGNTYGVLLLCFFMGNGLVGLPIRLWQLGDNETELHRLYLQATVVEGRYQEARFALEDCEVEVGRFVQRVSSTVSPGTASKLELLKHANMLEKVASSFDFPVRSTSRSGRARSISSGGGGGGGGDASSVPVVDDESASDATNMALFQQHLVDLNARLKGAQFMALVSLKRWLMLCKRAKALDSLALVQMPLSSSGGGAGAGAGAGGIFSQLMQSCGGSSSSGSGGVGSARQKAKSVAVKVISVCCFLLSAVIIWSELVMASSLHSPIALMLGLYNGIDGGGTASPVFVQTLTFLTLAYMSICAYWSLFRINMFGLEYTLQSPQLSAPAALIVNAEYFCRMQFSLGFNFLLILNAHEAVDHTTFRSLMANMEIVPIFGSSFTVYVPIAMVIVSIATLFNGYGYCLKMVGIEPEESLAASSLSACLYGTAAQLDPDDEERLSTGKKLVRAEWRTQEGQEKQQQQQQQEQQQQHGAADGMGGATVSPMMAGSARRVAIEMPTRSQRLEPKLGYADLNVTDHDDDYDDEGRGRGRGVGGGGSRLGGGATIQLPQPHRQRLESWGLGEDDQEDEEQPTGRY